MKTAIVLWFALSAAAQDQTGQISGTVVDAATHQPVKRATVSVNFLTGPPSGQWNHATSTDASGAFTFEGVPEGRYVLTATHQSYPPNIRRQRHVVEIKPGERAGSITVELIPGAVIAGHVFDEEGDPLPGCNLQAMGAASRPGEPQMGIVANSGDDGEYRIPHLAPGKYVVSARCGTVPFTPRPFSAGPDPKPSLGYPVQFYPTAADAKSAQAIDLGPGAEKPGVDFRMRPAPITQVRGALQSDAPAEGTSVQLIPIGGWDWVAGTSRDTAKGTFEFERVFAGSYYVAAQSIGDPLTRVTAIERIEVKDQPVNVALKLTHGVDVAGTVSIEGDNANNKSLLTQLQVHLQQDLPIGGDVALAPVKADGGFVIGSVPAGRWNVSVMNAQVYLKSAWLGNTDVTHAGFEVSVGAEGLRIVVSANLGSVTGTAPAGEMVFLAGDDRMQGTNVMQVDQTGRFTFPQIRPGKYRVGLTDPGSPVPEDGGEEITVKEGETVTVELKEP